MNLQDNFNLVTQSSDYQQWRKKNTHAFLCSFFRVRDGDNDNLLQVDFYNTEKDAISSFIIEENTATLRQENAEVLKKKDEVVQQLDLERVTIEEDDALDKIEELQQEKYSNEKIIKFIIILQCKEQVRWNISAITHSLHILNVKIDAENGKILEESFTNLLAFAQRQDE